MTYTHKQAVAYLVEYDINDIVQMSHNSDYSYLHDLLLNGVKGYSSYTIKELEKEIHDRTEKPVTVTA